ncbi:MAG: transporter substrate-binding domain-containing protein [Sulfitobacter sp.]
MKQSTTMLGASALVLSLTAGATMAQEACKTYRVGPGDTLVKISRAAYGEDLFRMIYDANKENIGRNPDVITVGTLLRLPCLTNTAAVDAVAAPASQDSAEPIVLITGNDFPPFTDESLPSRGLFTELVETAAYRAAPQQSLNVKFVNDWDAHLETLLPAMAFSGSFPWSRPDCEQPATLSTGDKNRCDNYLYSDPFYEIVDGYFARNGSGYETATSHDELIGANICRPEGYSTGPLDQVGLREPEVKLVRPVNVSTCFEELFIGTVDIVAIDSQVAVETIAALGLKNEITENPNLGAVDALYVLVHKDQERAAETLDILNRGLREMQESGEWFEIVSTTLERRMVAQTN